MKRKKQPSGSSGELERGHENVQKRKEEKGPEMLHFVPSMYSLVSQIGNEYGSKTVPIMTYWFDIEEKAPPEDEIIIICTKNGIVGEGRMNGDGTFVMHRWSRTFKYDEIKCWMHSPLAPKEM